MITDCKVVRNRNVPGEWIVRTYNDGARYPAGDYFTNDRDDADQTALAMLSSYRMSQSPQPVVTVVKPTLAEWLQANPQAYRAECNGCPVIHAERSRDDVPGLFHLADYGVSSVCSGPTYWLVARQ